MSKAWVNIATTEIDAESPVTEDLVEKYFDRDESLISIPVDTRFSEETTSSGTFVTLKTLKLWIPAWAGTTGGDVTLVVVFQPKVTAGSSPIGRVRMRLGASGTWQETSDISNTSYGTFFTLTILAADVLAAADSEEDLEVQAKISSGSGSVEVKCDSSASRLERAA